jgi:dipeptidyl-peptidase-4
MRTVTPLALLLAGCASAASKPSMTTESQPRTPRAALSESDEKFLRDLAETKAFTLGKPSKFRLTPDGSLALFLRAEPRRARQRLYAMEVATGQLRELITPEQVLGQGGQEQLSAEERARRERMRITGGGFTGFDLSRDGKQVLTALSGRVFLVEIATGKSVQVAGPDAKRNAPFDAHLSPDGSKVAFVRGGELWVAPSTGGEPRQITKGAGGSITHAQAEFVAQEEMKRFTGHWWTADSQSLIYEEADATGVEQIHFVDPANLFGPFSSDPYPRPGKANVAVRIGLVPAAGGETRWIDWDRKKYEYLARVHAFDDAPITIQVQTRDQRDLLLLEVDPRTGKTSELHREHDDIWVNLSDDYRWLPGARGFLWPTERNGLTQLELRGRDGKLIREVTPRDLDVRHLRWVDPRGQSIVVAAGKEPVEQQLFEIPLDGGAPRALVADPGFHDGHFARETRAHVRTTTRIDSSEEARVVRPDGGVAGGIPSVAEKPPAFAKVELGKVGPAPGYWTALLRPRDFDPKKKYPVWLSVYGGPGHNVVVASRDSYTHEQWIADHGFIVAKIDNRGTLFRGREWERAIKDKFADVPIEDQIAGLKALAAGEPAMDLSRVGITGGSFGGYLAALGVLRRGDFFKAAVAVSSVAEWLDYDTHYTERYLGVPGNDDKVYPANGLIQYAGNLSRPLLLIHGTADDNVHFLHTLKLADALFRAGRRFELLPLAGQTHQVGADATVRLQHWRRVFEFFHDHL